MSLIRKPTGPERASSLRRAVEVSIEGGKQVREAGEAAGRVAASGMQKIVAFWLLGGFTLAAVTASGIGAKLLGLLLLSPFYYIVWRKRSKAS